MVLTVGNREFASYEPFLLLSIFLSSQMILVNSIDPLGLILITSDTVFDLLRSVAD